MKNRKMLIVAGAALLALVAAGLLSLREPSGVRAPADAASSPRRTVNRLPPAGHGPKPASTVAAAVAPTGAVPATQTPTGRGTLPFVLTARTPFDQPLRLAAEALGAKTVSSVSRKALLVEATPAVRARLKADARFEDVVEFRPTEKIQPELAALVSAGAKEVEVSIVSLDAVDREAVVAALRENGGEMLEGCINEGDTIRAKVSADCIATLSGRGDVRWMERFVRPQLMNDQAVLPEAMDVTNVWNVSRDLGLNGAGQKISTSDSGIDTGSTNTMHRDLRERVKGIYIASGCDSYDGNGHGTHTAGSIVGDGTMSEGRIRGTAHGAELYAWFCGKGGGRGIYTPSSASDLFRPKGVLAYIHSASWGSSVNGSYTSSCRSYDQYVWDNPEFLPVFSAGNDGSSSMTIGSPGSAKNVLTVGATGNRPKNDPATMAYFSSRGPCKDGRIKPDIAAPGHAVTSTRSSRDGGYVENGYTSMSGTSMSCPLTAGAVALVRQWLVENRHFDGETEVSPGVTNKLPTAALMKAVIMGGAKDRVVPDFDQGAGRVDLANTLAPTNGCAVMLLDRIPFAANWSTNIVIETTNAAPLDVQLVWIDYPGSESGSQSTPRLVNDLDLIVESYGDGEGFFSYGNGGDEPDTLNNAELVRMTNAAPGTYIITIDCRNILYDHTKGGAAALYVRGAFDPDVSPEVPHCVHLKNSDEYFFSLDRALAAVQEDGETVEILRPTHLYSSVTVPKGCTVVTNAAEAGVDPIVRCGRTASVTVPEDVAFALEGVTFTNACAGFSVAGALTVRDNTLFEALKSVTVAEGGRAGFTNVAVAGDAPALAVASNGVVALNGFFAGGSMAGDWSSEGRLTLERSRLGDRQTVTVGNWGNLTIGGGVTNLAKVTLATGTNDNLTLSGALAQSVEIAAASACTNGAIFGSYTCDDLAAAASAPLFVNVLDPEGELGGTNVDHTLRWAVIADVPEAAAGARVNAGSGWRSYYNFKRALREATNANSSVMLAKDSVHAGVAALTHDLMLWSSNRLELAFGADAGFVIPAGRRLVLTNVVACGAGDAQKKVAFFVQGGEMSLESGAVLKDFSSKNADHKKLYYGGAVVVHSGSFAMTTGSRIENCFSHRQGGAVWVGGEATANLLGGTISGCSARLALGGGAVFAKEGSHVNVAGDFVASDNAMGEDSPAKGNLFLEYAAVFALSDELTGSVGVSFGEGEPDLNAKNVSFVSAAGLSETAKTNSAACFTNDSDANLVGGCVAGEIVWTALPPYDGTCDDEPSKASVWAYQEGSSTAKHYYEDLNLAIAYMTWDSPLYVMRDVTLTNDVAIGRKVVLLRDAALSANPTVWRRNSAQYRVAADGSLAVTNVTLYGVSSNEFEEVSSESRNGLISVDGGALTLGPGAVVGVVRGSVSRAANAISVFNGGELVMESGSVVTNGSNAHVDESDATGCGGGILLDKATAHFKGGAVCDCRAYRAGGVYIANGSTVSVSGDFTASGNRNLKGKTDNVVVSGDSKFTLDGLLSGGTIGMNEGISCDTNVFGAVCESWTNWPVSKFERSAAQFKHDFTGAKGIAVTNGTEALLVWSTALTQDEGDRLCYTDGTGRRYGAVETGTLLPPQTDPAQIPTELAKLTDPTLQEKITTLEEYNEFRTWADGVEGGKEAVAASEKAYVSYEFGVTVLFVSDPTVEITVLATAGGVMTVGVVVKDGEDAKTVASAKVAKLFRGTSDVSDWSDAKKLELTVTDLTKSSANKVSFTVTPAGAPEKAFLRLEY